uniref:Uncharacterized protein n=1 Tax=Clytia hemisphaerica TaxID=252671 RepID=A0A7M5VE92_9CNID
MNWLSNVYIFGIICATFNGFSVEAGQAKPANVPEKPAYAKEVDDLGLKIEEKGKEIDRLGAQIDQGSDDIEKSIDAHMNDVDSPVARQRIEDRGKDIDALSDYMDRVVDQKDAEMDEQVTGTKHSVMENGTDVVLHVRETPMDRMMRMMDENSKRVQSIGDSIEKDTDKRNTIPKVHERLLNSKTNLRRDSIQLDPNDADSRIAVPVTQTKLNKLLMFYYIKKRYPKLVNHLIDTESVGKLPSAGVTVNLNKSINALEVLSDKERFKNVTNIAEGEDLTGSARQKDHKEPDPNVSKISEKQFDTVKSIASGTLKDNEIDSIMSRLVDTEVNGADKQSHFESLNIDLGEEGSSNNGMEKTSLSKKLGQETSSGKESAPVKSDLDVDKISSKDTTAAVQNTDVIEDIAKSPSQEAKDVSTKGNVRVDGNKDEDKTSSSKSEVNISQSKLSLDKEQSGENSKVTDGPTSKEENILSSAKGLLKDVEDLESSLKNEEPHSQKFIENTNEGCEGVSCMTKELVTLFDENYSKRQKSQAEENNIVSKFSNNAGSHSEETMLPRPIPGAEESMGKKDKESVTGRNAPVAAITKSKQTDSKGPPQSAGDSISKFHDQSQSKSSPEEELDLFPGFKVNRYIPEEVTGQTRKGGDPYTSIGHDSIRHEHDHSSVVANKYYDKSIDSELDSFHGGNIGEWMSSHWGHGEVGHPGQHEHGQSGMHDHRYIGTHSGEDAGEHLHYGRHHGTDHHGNHGYGGYGGYGSHGYGGYGSHHGSHGNGHGHGYGNYGSGYYGGSGGHYGHDGGYLGHTGHHMEGVGHMDMHREFSHEGGGHGQDHHMQMVGGYAGGIDGASYGHHHMDDVVLKKGDKISEEHDYMIHSMPDLHAVHFGDNIMNAIPHNFQKIAQVEKEHKLHEKEAKEHEKMLKEALEGKQKAMHKEKEKGHHVEHVEEEPHGHLTDGGGFHHQAGHLYGMHGYSFNMHNDASHLEDETYGSSQEQEQHHHEDHDHFHHPGFHGSTEFIGDEVDFERGRYRESALGSKVMDHQYMARMPHQDEHMGGESMHHHHETSRGNHHVTNQNEHMSSEHEGGHHHHRHHHHMGHHMGHMSHHHGHHNQQSAMFKGQENQSEQGESGLHDNHHQHHYHHHHKIHRGHNYNQCPGCDQDLIHQHHGSKKCCNTSIPYNTPSEEGCSPCNGTTTLTGAKREAEGYVEKEGGDVDEHDDHDIDTGDEGDDEMYHDDHQHHQGEGGHHETEPQFGEEHHKPEEHHPGELHNGEGQEGKDFHGGDGDEEKDIKDEFHKEIAKEQGHHHFIHHEQNEHLHHHEFPIVHIDHEEGVHQDPGETVHNEHEMIQNQGTHSHVHEHPHQEVDSDDRIVPPEVVHEGPISPLPVFQGEEFHGPGIRDTPDVHFEDEMDTSRYRHGRSVEEVKQNSMTTKKTVESPGQTRQIFLMSSEPYVAKRQDPYGSIGHYPEMHMDIHKLHHHEIHSDHEGHFGCNGYGGGYGWCPDGIGFGGHGHHHNHHHHHHRDHHDYGDEDYDDDYGHHDYHDEDEGSGDIEEEYHHSPHHFHDGERRGKVEGRDATDDEHSKKNGTSTIRRVYHGIHNDTKVVHIHREMPKQDGSDDYMEHDQFIEPPSTELQSFNGHILMSIPHFEEQIATEPEANDLHNKTSKEDKDRHGEASEYYARDNRPENEQLAEHLDVQDQGDNRVVHITPHFQKKSQVEPQKDDVDSPKGTIDSQPLQTFNPFCRDENGKMKLDIDGKKRQVISHDNHPQPCSSQDGETAQDATVSKLLNDDDILPEELQHEKEENARREEEWKNEEGAPYIPQSVNESDDVPSPPQGENVEAEMSDVLTPQEKDNLALNNDIEHIHEEEIALTDRMMRPNIQRSPEVSPIKTRQHRQVVLPASYSHHAALEGMIRHRPRVHHLPRPLFGATAIHTPQPHHPDNNVHLHPALPYPHQQLYDAPCAKDQCTHPKVISPVHPAHEGLPIALRPHIHHLPRPLFDATAIHTPQPHHPDNNIHLHPALPYPHQQLYDHPCVKDQCGHPLKVITRAKSAQQHSLKNNVGKIVQKNGLINRGQPTSLNAGTSKMGVTISTRKEDNPASTMMNFSKKAKITNRMRRKNRHKMKRKKNTRKKGKKKAVKIRKESKQRKNKLHQVITGGKRQHTKPLVNTNQKAREDRLFNNLMNDEDILPNIEEENERNAQPPPLNERQPDEGDQEVPYDLSIIQNNAQGRNRQTQNVPIAKKTNLHIAKSIKRSKKITKKEATGKRQQTKPLVNTNQKEREDRLFNNLMNDEDILPNSEEENERNAQPPPLNERQPDEAQNVPIAKKATLQRSKGNKRSKKFARKKAAGKREQTKALVNTNQKEREDRLLNNLMNDEDILPNSEEENERNTQPPPLNERQPDEGDQEVPYDFSIIQNEAQGRNEQTQSVTIAKKATLQRSKANKRSKKFARRKATGKREHTKALVNTKQKEREDRLLNNLMNDEDILPNSEEENERNAQPPPLNERQPDEGDQEVPYDLSIIQNEARGRTDDQSRPSAKRTSTNKKNVVTSKSKNKETNPNKIKRKSKLHHVIAGKRHQTTKTQKSSKQAEKSEKDKEDNVFGSLINDQDIMPMTYNEANAHTGEEKYAADADAPPPSNEVEHEAVEGGEGGEGVTFDMPSHDHRHDVVEQDHFHHLNERLPQVGLNQQFGNFHDFHDAIGFYDDRNTNIHPSIPFPMEQLAPDSPIVQTPCTKKDCLPTVKTANKLELSLDNSTVPLNKTLNVSQKNQTSKAKEKNVTKSVFQEPKYGWKKDAIDLVQLVMKKDQEVWEKDHHHRYEHEPSEPYEGENGSEDFAEHDSHILIPDINVDRFNQHVHPAIPHIQQQLEEDYHHYHWPHHHHHYHNNHDHHGDGKEGDKKKEHKEHKEPHEEHMEHHHHDLQHPEPQHPQDHDEHRMVHVHPPSPWFIKPKDQAIGELIKRHHHGHGHGHHNRHHCDCDEEDDEEDEDECCEQRDHYYGFEGEDGSNDFSNHHIHIHEPDPNLHRFNQHIHPAIPHLYEQLEHDPYQPHYHISHRHHWAFQPDHYNKKDGNAGGEGQGHEYMGHLKEHQHSQDHDEDRLVYINPHLHHYEVDGYRHHHDDDDDDDEEDDDEDDEGDGRDKKKNGIQRQKPDTRDLKTFNHHRQKRHVHHHGFRHHYCHSYDGCHHGDGDDDDEGDEEDGYRRTTGRDVSHLSYETEQYGRDMQHDIAEETHHVEDVGDAIENTINAGIARVKHLGHDIEAPDYDRRGHFYPNVHEEDIVEEVEERFPHVSQRDLINAVIEDHYHRRQDHRPLGRPVHIHRHEDEDDDDDDD